MTRCSSGSVRPAAVEQRPDGMLTLFRWTATRNDDRRDGPSAVKREVVGGARVPRGRHCRVNAATASCLLDVPAMRTLRSLQAVS